MTCTMKKIGLSLFVLFFTTHVLANVTLESVLGDKYVTRSSWGSIPRDYEKMVSTGQITVDGKKDVSIFHHTVTGCSHAIEQVIPLTKELEILHHIESYHIATQKWADVGYHYLISQNGMVYEARPCKFQGAHTLGLNEKTYGVAFIGCYDSVGCPAEGYKVTKVTEEMMNSAAKLLGYLSFEHGLELTEQAVVGRSVYEGLKKGKIRFPFSPGNLVLAQLGEIISRAKVELEVLVAAAKDKDEL